MTAQGTGREFPRSHGNRSWSVLYSPGAFDYVTQRPDGVDGKPGDMMLGGGLFRSRSQGLDQLGRWDDGKRDAFPLMHLRGSMSTIFEPHWGAEDGGLKKAWTGIMGFTGDVLPFVGPLPAGTTASAAGEGEEYQEQEAKAGLQGSGQWIAAGFNGDGMVSAWLSGTAVGIMMLDKGDEVLERVAGRPGGKLNEWFPMEEFAWDADRLKRAHLKNLAAQVM